MHFDRLGLSAPILRALEQLQYVQPTPIQQQTIAQGLAGRDVLGCAQTGTGKTAAFALPILQRLAAAPQAQGKRRPIRALILTPTRELAAQVEEGFRDYGRHLPLYTTLVHGGVSERPQITALQRGVDILVATPGRLLDLMNQRHVQLDKVETLVLDEADRMLDMGFLPDIRRIVAKVPTRRQTLLFSATLPHEIRDLARGLLANPVEVSVAPPSTPAELVDQSVYFVAKPQKTALLLHLLEPRDVTRALVFTRTKHGADRVARALTKDGVKAEAIHGNKSQGQRTRALTSFKAGGTRVLVASDIAARGLDIDEISHVINFDLPNEPETYVHRIGRTARAGATGIAFSFCDREERAYLKQIERLIGKGVRVVDDHPYRAGADAPRPPVQQQQRGRNQGGRSQQQKRTWNDRPQQAARPERRSWSDDRQAPRAEQRRSSTHAPRFERPARPSSGSSRSSRSR
jgi:ATP-dependent RNA helicase RhlE